MKTQSEIERHIRRQDRIQTIQLWIVIICATVLAVQAVGKIWRLF